MRRSTFLLIALALSFQVAQIGCQADEKTKILFLSKSSGFQHSSIKRKDDAPSHVEKILQGMSNQYDADITITKDASLINAENLKNYDIVVFYTTGDLTKTGTDGHPAMSDTGLDELVAWIEAGGAFMGYHCAADTFHGPTDGPPSKYINMIGGEFERHGMQFEGTVEIVDTSHPAMQSLPKTFSYKEEWYMFKNLNKEKIHVLALFDPGETGRRQKMYQVPKYPIIWCSALGEGRVYYNAIGHREDIWDDPTFQQSLIDAAQWVAGIGRLQADPNYNEVVPAE